MDSFIKSGSQPPDSFELFCARRVTSDMRTTTVGTLLWCRVALSWRMRASTASTDRIRRAPASDVSIAMAVVATSHLLVPVNGSDDDSSSSRIDSSAPNQLVSLSSGGKKKPDMAHRSVSASEEGPDFLE